MCREWGLPVSLEREEENKTGRERQEREGGRKTKKKNDYLRDTLYNTSGCTSHSVESGLHATSCSPESRHVEGIGWRKRLLFLICMKTPLFAKSHAHHSKAIWGSVPFKKYLGPSLAVQWSVLHLQVQGVQVQSMVPYDSPPKNQMIKQKQYGN